MSEHPVNRPDRGGLDLERELAALATAIDWPPTPDVAAAVRVRLAAGAPRPSRRWWFAPPRLSRPLLIALLLLALLAAVATAVALGLPGLRITFTSDPLPTPNVPAATATTSTGSPPASAPAPIPGSDLGLGTPMALAAARARLGVPLLMPAVPGRPGPDGAFVSMVRGSAIVTLTWGTGPDLPPLRAGSDVGLLVTVLRASVGEGLMEKLVRTGTTVERVEVGGHRGFWVSGGEHLVWFRREDGEVVDVPIRLAGDTLALEIDGRVVRLEVAGGREVAIALAETIAER